MLAKEKEFGIEKWQARHLMPLDSLSKKILMEFIEKVKQVVLRGTHFPSISSSPKAPNTL